MGQPVRVELENGVEQNSAIYEWKSLSLTATGSTPNIDLAGLTPSNTSNKLFTQLKRAHRLSISTTVDIFVELSCDGSAQGTYDAIKITSTTPLIDFNCVVDKIYAATGNVAAVIVVYIR